MPQTEILNLEYNRKVLTVKALNKCRIKKEAAEALQISERSLHRWVTIFNIQYDQASKQYFLKSK